MTPRGDGADAEVPATLEIRLHGRGGQGGVTCAKILAAVYASLGKSVQTFGDYAGERSGAPVRAYTRVSDRPVENRNKVYRPHHLLVLDPTLLSDDTVSGLADGGTLLLNTPEPLASFSGRFERFRLAVIDATGIARRHKIGTRSLVIVNTTIAGAFVRALDLPLAALEETYHHLRLDSNFAAAREAYENVALRAPSVVSAPDAKAAMPASLPHVMSLVDHVEGRATGLHTGSWRTQLPRYVKSLAPCNAFCPAGNDVIQFVQALTKEEGGVRTGAEILGRSTPLAGVCGRVCPAPCMAGCNRTEHDGAVNIRGIERFIADHEPVAVRKVERLKDARRFAIVGGGPAGISAAYELARAGHDVTIFDGERALGGVLRTGIPTYRLPRDVLDREVSAVLSLGVEAKLGEFLDANRIASLAREFDSMIVATGLQRLRGLDGAERDIAGVEQGIHFLHRINLESGTKVSGHVVVLGGGNTAMDCARSALRAGAARVTVAYRRSRAEMPAIAEEIDEAEHEGIAMLYLRAPLGFEREGAKGPVKKVVLAEVDLGPADESGRRSPIVTDRKAALDCDLVLLALGQSADLSLLPRGWSLRDGRLHEGETPLNVFGAGDLATGDGTVTHAIGDGRRAATRAMRALGIAVEEFKRPDRAKAVAPTDVRLDHFPKLPQSRERLLPVLERVKHFDEVSAGLADGHEASRCFSCGECTHCDTCLVYCPEGIIHRKGPDYEVDLEYCKGCGICVVECPRKAMEMTGS
jgi:2-oxoacid:acceptor oxidoreductase gamma subunit (pyruvate/2-ketoisovalerate family)